MHLSAGFHAPRASQLCQSHAVRRSSEKSSRFGRRERTDLWRHSTTAPTSAHWSACVSHHTTADGATVTPNPHQEPTTGCHSEVPGTHWSHREGAAESRGDSTEGGSFFYLWDIPTIIFLLIFHSSSNRLEIGMITLFEKCPVRKIRWRIVSTEFHLHMFLSKTS